jgi:hypothetical protein
VSRLTVVRDLWDYLKVRKKLWLMPVVIVLLVLGIVILISSSAAIAPFIYALF